MILEEEVQYDIEKNHKCDVYVHPNSKDEDQHVIVIVHGGAWMMGNKRGMRSMAQTLCCKTGLVCVVPEYSLSQMDSIVLQNVVIINWLVVGALCILAGKRGAMPLFLLFCIAAFITICVLVHIMHRVEKKQNAHPVHVTDIAKCMQWISHESPRWEKKRPKFVLVGHSAGAHLCALVTLNPRFLDESIREQIKGVVCISGLYSFFRLQDSVIKFFINRGVFADSAHGLTHRSYAQLSHARRCQCKDHCAKITTRWDHVIDAWPVFQIEHHAHHYSHRPRFLVLTAELDISLILHACDLAHGLALCEFPVDHLHFKRTTHFSIHHYWDSKHQHIANAIVRFIKEVACC